MPKETKLIMEVWRRFLKSQSARRSQERFKQTGKRKTIPPEAFDRMIGGYEPPSEDEGWDKIIHVPAWRG
jgi:tRNA uridine 5-carbamoylmethylation protein Kti12